jgi:GMP synthase-like glutamine amidotransferase
MKPVAIFRHTASEGPAYFAIVLERHQIPYRLIRVDAGEAVPKNPHDFSGLVFMGGPMSVNDDLPWIPPILNLIRAGVAADIPVLGHCLGGQLMSKALGGSVGPNPVKEIGWGPVTVAASPAATRWFGHAPRTFTSFHWHGETFTIPPGSELILSSPYCSHQAFTLGKHLGMQCHIEMTRQMIATWCEGGAAEIAASDSPAVQSVATIEQGIASHLPTLSVVADGVYAEWIKGLKP